MKKIEDMEAARRAVREKVIVALDVPTMEEALGLMDLLQGRARFFKIGHRLFTRYGPRILEACEDRDVEIFLDLKLYDIPSVVGDACAHISGHKSVFMTTVHASGGPEMVEAAVEGVQRGRSSRPVQVIAVTALTSFSDNDLPQIGVSMRLQDWAARLADSALGAGADGLVSSAREVPSFRESYGADPILVTPGIRLKNVAIAGDDQQRIDTPGRTLARGSSMLVVGRPIYQAPDPVEVIEVIAESILEES